MKLISIYMYRQILKFVFPFFNLYTCIVLQSFTCHMDMYDMYPVTELPEITLSAVSVYGLLGCFSHKDPFCT